MTDSTLSNRPGRPAPRFFGPRALLLAGTVALGVVAVPSVAQASASHSAPSSTSACSRISAVQVGRFVHHSVPAGTYYGNTVKATKQDDEVSGVVESCIFGSQTTLKALANDVILSYEVTSKPLNGSQLQFALAEAESLKFKFTPYSGLGMKAYYYSFTIGGTPVQGMAAIDGTKIYSAGIYIKAPAAHELAALVQLAEKL
jgi:hypothetical protein